MAKRSRGAARPGQMRPARRQQTAAGRAASAATTDAVRPSTRPPTEDVVVDVDLPVEERSAAKGRQAPAQQRMRSDQASSLLASRAAQEYAYVARDVRHIVVVGGGLFIVLMVLWFLVEVVHIIPL